MGLAQANCPLRQADGGREGQKTNIEHRMKSE